jgi:hypothetical protein
MSDITMCSGQMCAKKETCYRFTAPLDKERQSYFVASPINMLTGECDKYWEVKDGS